MLFPTPEFLIFFALLLCGLLLLTQYRDRKCLMLLASYIFYMWWNPVFILLIVFSTIIDYIIGQRMSSESRPIARRNLLILSMCANLGVLGFFKYANFFQENIAALWSYFDSTATWNTLDITLPVGISFYTFQTMSYSIDVYRRNIPACHNSLDFALFVSFFPQLVAGPIVRAVEFLPQLQSPKAIQIGSRSLLLILRGLMKKVIIADNLAPLVDRVFSTPEAWPSVIIWIATIAFGIQIYCDFSGYSDIAIGIARILGFDLPLNFNWPYFATNPSMFWRKWHISLSTWLRDYLYIPLGGNRQGKFNVYRNLMLTMLLGGFWHGASWNFVLWGGLHGGALIAHKLYVESCSQSRLYIRLHNSLLYSCVSWACMQVFVLLTWITFRITDTSKMLIAVKKFLFFDFNFSLGGIGIGSLSFFSALSLMAAFAILHTISWRVNGLDRRLDEASWPVLTVICFAAGLTCVWLWPTSETPFIYFQF